MKENVREEMVAYSLGNVSATFHKFKVPILSDKLNFEYMENDF